ncbi:hypothetical protein HQN59_13775 [Schlegelella sp. ID0723]|uniref:Uncharacterized protein n=2 Tax=Piscinibacter koreensis TaxID=2742824 RepID=A0A7Y6TX65_9BURK|nr:hypothetical protein [Schlegelella koreensis]
MTREPLAAGEPVLEDTLAAVESQLGALGSALRARDADAIDRHAAELHRAMASAVEHFSRAARSGAVPPALRHRLARASGQVAAQRESLARATAALDRAIDVLLPRENLAVYAASGSAERSNTSGVLRA